MSIPDDLLEQARHLASRETRRPKQASLRRAVSSAYYALFHLLVKEAAASLVSDKELRTLVARAFDHREMKKAAAQFRSVQVPAGLRQSVGATVPKDLRDIAEAFLELQEARHKADYSFAHSMTRTEVRGYIHRAEQAFAAWNRVKTQKAATAFLAALLLANRWSR